MSRNAWSSAINAKIELVTRRNVPCFILSSGSASRTRKHLSHRRDELLHVDWLALVGVESSARDPLAISGHHRGRHGDNWSISSCRLGPQSSEGLNHVDPRKSDVHQDQVRMSLPSEAHALFAGLGFDDLVALERQHVPDELAVPLVVFDNQDQLTRHGPPAA